MARSKDKLTLLTLNTHSWQEADNVSCLRHVAEALREEQPDVSAFQEVNQKEGGAPASGSRLKESGFVSAGDAIAGDNWALRLSELAPGYQWSWAFVHIGYSLNDFKNPNNLMLGMGLRFNNKRKSL